MMPVSCPWLPCIPVIGGQYDTAVVVQYLGTYYNDRPLSNWLKSAHGVNRFQQLAGNGRQQSTPPNGSAVPAMAWHPRRPFLAASDGSQQVHVYAAEADADRSDSAALSEPVTTLANAHQQQVRSQCCSVGSVCRFKFHIAAPFCCHQ